MANAFSIDLTQIRAVVSRLKDLPQHLTELVDAELNDGAEAIAAEAKQRAPGDQGLLRNEIGAQKIGTLAYEVYSNALYSAFLEFGTRANVDIPPGLEEYAAQFIGSAGATALTAKDAIFAWCERKGIDKSAWYAIYITLLTKGGKPHPFFFPAVNRILPIIINRITKVLSEDAFK